ncbi:hypothetical protein [Lacinutrix sp. Bg11-31]|uniref:hypothetical protein n=1 Tax=Lacinutrix sp. Bg11-31 TaxID=2057808 RepID=UPI0012FD24B8|nr:hypothetical protein [Lacinutrix sp. Bg11-31]
MTKEDQDEKKILDELIILTDKTFSVKYSFFNKLTPVILGFLGLLVSLKSGDNSSKVSSLLFFSTILLLGLCVIFSLAVLYSELHYSKKTLKNYKDAATKHILDGCVEKSINVNVEKTPFYEFCEKMTLISLGLSILSLIIYSCASTFCI